MKALRIWIAAGVLAAGLALAGAAAGGEAPGAQPIAFPAGSEWDYPLSARALEAAVAGRQEHRIREHGWHLFAAVNTAAPDGLPIWRSWPNTTAAFAAGEAKPVAPGKSGEAGIKPARHLIQIATDNFPVSQGKLPIYMVPPSICTAAALKDCPGTPQSPYTLADGPVFQNNGDIMIANVSYNQPAFDYIRGKGTAGPLFEAAQLTALLPAKDGIAAIPGFPSDAIVIKNMYWPVKGDRCTALPVWDDPKPPKSDDYIGYEVWKRGVAVAGKGCGVPPGGTTKVSYLHGILDAGGKPLPAVTFEEASVVPLDRFYHQTFSQADIDALDPRDRAILDASSIWVSGQPFAAGDSLVSIGMHIFTKEIPGWTMQTFWWHDRPDAGPYAADRPDIPTSQAPAIWRNYVMASEYGMPSANDPDKLPVVSNPYIELVAHPAETNCRNCHLRAAWARKSSGMKPFAGEQVMPIEDDPGLLANLRPDSPIFRGLLLLDYQWAISDRAIPLDYEGASR